MARALHLWYALTENVPPSALRDGFLGVLSAEEQERYSSLLGEEHRHSYLLAHALVRKLIAEKLGLNAADLRFAKDPRGKPRLRDVPGTEFSLSHADGIVACIAGDTPVGVDVEPIERGQSLEEIFSRFLGQAEKQELPGAARAEKLIELWTCKEALLKASGVGLSRRIQDISILTDGSGIRVQWQGREDQHWQVRRFRVGDRFAGAVANERDLGDIRVADVFGEALKSREPADFRWLDWAT